MDRIFYTEREWYPSTEKLIRKIFASRYAIKDAEIERGETGKPFLRGTPYFFSVTHSDRMYFIAVSDINVGIDAEPMNRKVDYEKFSSVFRLKSVRKSGIVRTFSDTGRRGKAP